MKRIIALIFSVAILSGCAAKQIPYSPSASVDLGGALRTVEQVIMEQPVKHRPSNVYITDEYIAFDNGYETKTSGFATGSAIGNGVAILSGRSKSTGKFVGSRMYFNSLGVPNIYKKRGWYIIDVVNPSGHRIKRIYTRSLEKAKLFIDSLFILMTLPEIKEEGKKAEHNLAYLWPPLGGLFAKQIHVVLVI